MQYKGIYEDQSGKYTIIKAINISYARYDFYKDTQPLEETYEGIFQSLLDDTPKKTKNQIDGTLITSVFVDLKQKGISTFGDFQIYQRYKNLEDTINFRYYPKESVVYDKIEATEKGFVREYLTKDETSENYIKELNSTLLERRFNFGDTSCILTKSSSSNSVQLLKGIEYKLRTFKEHDYSDTLNKTRSFAEIAKIKDLSWTKDKDYRLITTVEGVKDYIKKLKALKKNHLIGFDTETSGFKFNSYPEGHRQRDRLVGICMSYKDDEAVYITLQHTNIENAEIKETLKLLKPLLESLYLVTHNGAFDYKVMLAYGIQINMCEDTYILERFLSSGDITAKAGLKFLVGDYFKIDQVGFSDIFITGNNYAAFQDLPADIVRIYAPADADFTRKLCKILKPRLPAHSYALYGEEIKCAKNLAWIEYHGCKINTDKMYKAYQETADNLKALEEAIHEMAGYKFNIKSVDQLSTLLYKKLGCPQIVKMKNNPDRPAVDNKAKAFLSKIPAPVVQNRYKHIVSKTEYKGTEKSTIGEDGIRRKILVSANALNASKYPITHLLLLYSELEKQLSSFYGTIERKLKDNDDGMIFSEYKQLRAATGRIISANINFQQIPGDLKDMVIPYSDDYYVVDADFSSVELRIMVSLAQDKVLLDKMRDPENDIHKLIVSQIMKKEAYEVTDTERKKGKKYNFGVPYDMGDRAFAELLYGYPITRENIQRAAQEKKDYLNSMPRVRDNFEDFRNYAQLNGFIKTKFGRYLYLPDLPTATDTGAISRDRRRAGNFPIQGLAADIFKIALNRLLERFRETGKDIFCPGLIHDEVLLFVNKKHHPYEIIMDIRECMELVIPNFSTLFTGIAVGDSWGDCKNGPYELPIGLTDRMINKVKTNTMPVIEGSYKDYIYNEKIEYLKERFRSYSTDMGFDWSNPEANDISKIIPNMTSMFIGSEIRGMYGPKDKSLSEETKLALSFVNFIKEETGVDLSHTVNTKVEQEETNNIIDLTNYMTSMQVINDLYDIKAETVEEGIEEEDTIIDLEEYHKHFSDAKEHTSQGNITHNNLLDILVTRDEVILDISSITRERLNLLVEYLKEEHADNNYFAVKYKFNNQIVETNFKLEVIDRDILSTIIHKQEVAI